MRWPRLTAGMGNAVRFSEARCGSPIWALCWSLVSKTRISSTSTMSGGAWADSSTKLVKRKRNSVHHYPANSKHQLNKRQSWIGGIDVDGFILQDSASRLAWAGSAAADGPALPEGGGGDGGLIGCQAWVSCWSTGAMTGSQPPSKSSKSSTSSTSAALG